MARRGKFAFYGVASTRAGAIRFGKQLRSSVRRERVGIIESKVARIKTGPTRGMYALYIRKRRRKR